MGLIGEGKAGRAEVSEEAIIPATKTQWPTAAGMAKEYCKDALF